MGLKWLETFCSQQVAKCVMFCGRGGTAQLSQHAEQVSQSARRQSAVPIVHLWVVSASSAFIRFRQWLESCQWLGSSMEANPWLQRAAYLVLKFSTVFGALSLFGGKPYDATVVVICLTLLPHRSEGRGQELSEIPCGQEFIDELRGLDNAFLTISDHLISF